jgi:hypothetical protein
MHPSQAHDVVEQLMAQRLAEAEAARLGRTRRERRNGRLRRSARAMVSDSDEPKVRRLVLVTPQTTC